MIADIQTLSALIVTLIIDFALMIYVSNIKSENQLKRIFRCSLWLLILWILGLIMQITLSKSMGIKPIYFDYIAYIGICFIPLAILAMGVAFSKTKIKLKRWHFLLCIVPIVSLICLWTNDYHHLFFEQYSINIAEMVYGPYMKINNIYSYLIIAIGIIYLLRFTIKNSGIFSKQSLLMLVGISVPLTVNMLATFHIISATIYITPITFSFTILCCALAIFKFQFLGVAPIALQQVVDRMSDSDVVLNDNNYIVDFNKTFIKTFHLKEEIIRSMEFIDMLRKSKVAKSSINKLEKGIIKATNTGKTVSFEIKYEKAEKCFTVEITPISSNKAIIGTLVLLKDITQHKQDMATIRNNQEVLMERERLASLGQLIGGIAHNLKTPIMSISGAVEGLENLIKEYDESIDDPLVNSQDHHDIARDMESWIPKIRTHLEYMSDIITTVKGQAVALSNDEEISFTVSELVKRVNILMKHELKNSYIYLNVMMKTDENLSLKGDVNSLVQVINNMISNSIQAYNGKRDQNIEFEINQKENDVILSITDYAGGLPKEVQERLFKEMVTTKGKNGTGLGLYMSYSNIKARFNGDITFKTEEGKGTTFNIIIPITK